MLNSKLVRNSSSIFVAFVLLLSAVSTSWCAADCAAKVLSPSSCHHHDTVKVCDDPTTIVPDAAFPVPTLTFQDAVTTVIPWALITPPTAVGVRAPRPPLRL